MKALCAAGVLSICGFAAAQAGPELLLNPMTKGLTFDGSAAGTIFNSTDTDIAGVDAQLSRYTTQGRFRIMPDHKADPRVGYSFSYLNVDTDDDVIPSDLVNARLSVGTGIATFENGWAAGLTLGGGFAGANTFGDGDGFFGTATILVGGKLDENTTLGIALDYNGNRSFMPDVPLPGVVWTRQLPKDNLELSLGFPFSYGRWRPIEKLLLEVNFNFPDFVGGRVAYDLVDGVGLFASLARRTDAWHANDLPRNDDRILFEQTLAEAGVRFSLDDRFVLLVAGGYAFGQEFRVGFDSRETDELLELDDAPYVRVEGNFSF